MHASFDAAYFLFRKRKPAAANSLVIGVLAIFLLSFAVETMWPREMNTPESLIQIDLQTYSPAPPARPTAPATAVRSVRPVPTSTASPVDAVIPNSPAIQGLASAPQEPTGRSLNSAPRPEPVGAGSAAQSAAFEAFVKSAIEAKKSYPTGRQALLERPVGTVSICMVLNRAGRLLDSRIADSSGSILLDSAAKRLVSSVSFPPFPESYLVGKGQNEFCVRLKYELPN